MIDELLDGMRLEEQVALLAGADFWTTVAVERLGIPKIKVSDGPNGARGGGSLVGGVKSACFPVAIALGATWDPGLARAMGVALAEEARTKAARVLLAPTVNIQRSGLNGRNFECYAEDPHLTTELAVAYIEGLQSRGVAATVKHFVGNESEVERTTISSDIDERALREIYLPPFEAAVKRAGAWAVMTSYNRLNGTFTSEHRWLLEEVLRDASGASTAWSCRIGSGRIRPRRPSTPVSTSRCPGRRATAGSGWSPPSRQGGSAARPFGRGRGTCSG